MKVSQVIKNLQEFMDKYGDCECFHMVGDNVHDYHLDYDSTDGETLCLYLTWEGLFCSKEHIDKYEYPDNEYELVCILNA